MNLSFLVLTLHRCDAEPNDLDAPGSHRRTHEKTDFLIKNFDPGILWDEYGIRADIVVRKISVSGSFILTLPLNSRLPMAFRVLTFTNCCHLISCTSSLKVYSKTIS